MNAILDFAKFITMVVGFELVIWGVLQVIWKFAGDRLVNLQNALTELGQEHQSVR